MQPDEAAVYDLCMDLAKDHVVSDAIFKKARELFSDQQIVDLITVSGGCQPCGCRIRCRNAS